MRTPPGLLPSLHPWDRPREPGHQQLVKSFL